MITLKLNTATTQDYYSQTLIVLMYEIKTEDVYEDFGSDKEMFDFSNYSTKSTILRYYNTTMIQKISH